MKKILTMCAVSMAAMGVWADAWTDPSTGIVWTYSPNGEEVTIDDCSKTAGDIVVPAQIKGRSVTRLGDRSFGYCFITSIEFPESLTSIGETFFECPALKTLAIPEGVTNIGPNAFSACTTLPSVLIPASVEFLGEGAFTCCLALTEINVDSNNLNYKSVGGVLYNHDMTVLMVWPPLKDGPVEIPNEVVCLGDCAFGYCTNQTQITIPQGVRDISTSAFFCCSSLIQIDVVPDNAWFSSVDGVLYSKDASELVAYPSGRGGFAVISTEVRNIRGRAFEDNRLLTSIVIPNGVTNIGEWAFSRCLGLTNVCVSATVQSVGEGAFWLDDGFFSFEGAPPTGVGSARIKQDAAIRYNVAYEDKWLPVIEECGWTNAKHYYPVPLPEGGPYKETVEGLEWTFMVKNAETCVGTGTWGGTAVPSGTMGAITIPPTLGGRMVTRIGNYAFYGCSGLTSVTIPSSVTSIGNYAFYGCSGLTSVTIPSSVTSFGERAFSGCVGMQEYVVAPGNPNYKSANGLLLTKDGTTLLYGCNGDVVIPNGVTNIGKWAFECLGLTSVTMPDTVTQIGSGAFYECMLTNAELSAGLTYIDDYAFGYCYYLRGLSIPRGVSYIGTHAYDCCFGLEYIEVAEGNETFDSRGNCNALIETASNKLIKGCDNTVVPPGIISIGTYSFSYCRVLSAVKLPDSVATIESYAYFWCLALEEINIPRNVTSIEEEAFAACPSLTHIEVDAANSVFDSRDNCNAIIETASGTLVCGCKNTVIPSGVTTLARSAFRGCPFTHVDIPEGLRVVGIEAFRDSALTDVKLPSTLENIEREAFWGCNGLVHITIPARVSSMDYQVFDRCDNLNAVDFEGAPPESVENAYIKQDAAIRYNVAYQAEWLPIVKKCGWTNAKPYNPEVQPIVPGGEIVVPEGKAEAKAAEINGDPAVKAQYLKAPEGVETTADYLGCFDAIATSGSTVAFVLNENGTNEVAEATEVVKTAALDTVFSKESTMTIDKPLMGFYYSFKQGGDVSVGDEADLNKLGGRDTISFELAKGPLQYFYQTLVTPQPTK